GEGHPLLGRRVPDLELTTGEGNVRVSRLLRAARPLLIRLGGAGGTETHAGDVRVQVVEAAYEGPWELPVLGAVPAPSAVLVRPDGYVAWVGEGSEAGLGAALMRWLGAPRRSAPGEVAAAAH